jgi:hypothetical protein
MLKLQAAKAWRDCGWSCKSTSTNERSRKSMRSRRRPGSTPPLLLWPVLVMLLLRAATGSGSGWAGSSTPFAIPATSAPPPAMSVIGCVLTTTSTCWSRLAAKTALTGLHGACLHRGGAAATTCAGLSLITRCLPFDMSEMCIAQCP